MLSDVRVIPFAQETLHKNVCFGSGIEDLMNITDMSHLSDGMDESDEMSLYYMTVVGEVLIPCHDRLKEIMCSFRQKKLYDLCITYRTDGITFGELCDFITGSDDQAKKYGLQIKNIKVAQSAFKKILARHNVESVGNIHEFLPSVIWTDGNVDICLSGDSNNCIMLETYLTEIGSMTKHFTFFMDNLSDCTKENIENAYNVNTILDSDSATDDKRIFGLKEYDISYNNYVKHQIINACLKRINSSSTSTSECIELIREMRMVIKEI